MKKILSLLALLLFVSVSFAYSPTNKDINNLHSLRTQLDLLIVDNNINLRDFYNQVRVLQTEYSKDDRLNYMLANLKDHLYNKLYTQKTVSKESAKEFKQEFVDTYKENISKEIDDSLKNCTGMYNLLDDISFAYNFPTALTMSAWYRESTCAYYLPNNKRWPFQITNKNYGTWEISYDQFVTTVVDFMKHTKWKFDNYSSQLSGILTYTGFDLTGVANFAALYNGWTKSGNVILPNAPKYLYDAYGDTYSWATKYGILAQFIKTLERELTQ